MTTLKKTDFERRKLQELVREYSKLGYEVYAELKEYPRPDMIGGFVPDLVLKKGDQMIIVEIATRRNLRDMSQKIEQFARYAEEHGNVRFDLVFTNPRPRLSQTEKDISNKILLADVQKRLLDEANELYQMGYYQSSYLMLSILLENVLRELTMKSKAIDVHTRIDFMKLLPLACQRGIISESNYASLRRFFDCRNRILHDCYKPGKQLLQEYIEFVSSFARKGK